jgi:hypothetical protein
LSDKEPKTLHDMARSADSYAATRKAESLCVDQSSRLEEPVLDNSRPQSNRKGMSSKSVSFSSESAKSVCSSPSPVSPRKICCYFCNKPGHKISECRTRLRTEAAAKTPDDADSDCLVVGASDLSNHALFDQFCFQAQIVKSDGSVVPIRMLRDTGSTLSVISRSSADDAEVIFTGKTRLLKGLSSKVIKIPLVKVHLRSDNIDAKVWCGVVPELPEGVDFLFGKDLACPSQSQPADRHVVTLTSHGPHSEHDSADNGPLSDEFRRFCLSLHQLEHDRNSVSVSFSAPKMEYMNIRWTFGFGCIRKGNLGRLSFSA